jgi:hypothetical protein
MRVLNHAKGRAAISTGSILIIDEIITIAKNDGDDAPRYLEKQVAKALEKLSQDEP